MIFRSKPQNKYGARKVTTASGQTFDSVREYQRFCELNLMQRAGVITGLECQVKFELIPAQKVNGHTVRATNYLADFVYYRDGKKVVEDAKGCKTKEYLIKKKLMLHVHGIWITEV